MDRAIVVDRLPDIVVAAVPPREDLLRRARVLGRRLGLPVLDETPVLGRRLQLLVTERGLELWDPDPAGTGRVRIDAAGIVLEPRSRSRRQPLPKAIGRGRRHVLDATAGLGQDAMLLAAMGYRVTAVERSPVVAALLDDAVARARDRPRLQAAIEDRLSVIVGDARDVLRSLPARPDTVYIDPMFPPKRKSSALANKGVRLLRRLVGDDDDAADLLAIALEHTADRVVVKRPTHVDPLAGEPTTRIEGKLVRYDVYVCRKGPGD